MRYRNVKTGIEFSSSSIICGEDIVEVKAEKPEPKTEPKPKAEPKAEPKPKTTTKRSKK